MAHYKDLNNNIHFLDDEKFEHLLPIGCIKITDEEAKQISDSKIIPHNYKELRAAEYPPLEDYLDAISEDDKVAEKAYKDARKAINLKYPKDGV